MYTYLTSTLYRRFFFPSFLRCRYLPLCCAVLCVMLRGRIRIRQWVHLVSFDITTEVIIIIIIIIIITIRVLYT